MARDTDGQRFVNLRLDGDAAEWATFAASLEGQSLTAYVNGAIRRAKAAAGLEALEAFASWRAARRSFVPGEGGDEVGSDMGERRARA